MNYSIIIYIIGMILEIEAVFMALPAITALIYQETSGVAFLITIALCLVIGLPLTRKKPTRKAFYSACGAIQIWISSAQSPRIAAVHAPPLSSSAII